MATAKRRCGRTNADGSTCMRTVGKAGTCGVDHVEQAARSMQADPASAATVREWIRKLVRTDPVTGEVAPEAPAGRARRSRLLSRFDRLSGRAARHGTRRAARGAAGVATAAASATANPDGTADRVAR